MALVNILAKIGIALALLGTISSSVYFAMVIAATIRYRRRTRDQGLASKASNLPPVTILKPVHGLEPKLAENLASWFEQDYPDFEVLIGARDEENAALKVAREVRSRYPQVKSRIVLSGPPSFPNAKVFSLAKMIEGSSNQIFVISDSDILVTSDCLRKTIEPLRDKQTGLVTCIYRAVPAGDLTSLLES